ncbi:DUF3108 domain-containing protein [Microbulbifer hainanensis]|uniref:DUF3108 domain-containing protein n=1 Tax=Microbulbifer hainanensis TaxID=2735675 RepID=UPI0029C078DA|nr:DUF3108 domain-containing protein [Microbulbifer hainanensis]
MPFRFFAPFFALLIIVAPAHASEPQLKPFTATYEARYSGIGVSATRELSGSGNNWRLDFNVDSMFAKIREFSRFTRAGNQLTPQHYEYHKTGLGRDRHTVLNFEHATQRVVNLNNSKRTLEHVPEDTHDKLTYQLQLALDIAAGKKELFYRVADGKRIQEYRFAIAGRESLKTPLGVIETVKVERVRDDDSDRETTIWFAPQWDYALVKLMQQEDGNTYQIALTELTIAGKNAGTHQ